MTISTLLRLLGLVLFIGAFGCQNEAPDSESTAPSIADVTGKVYDHTIEWDGDIYYEDVDYARWECRNVEWGWTYDQGQITEIVACYLCYSPAHNGACAKSTDPYSLFKIVGREVEVEQDGELLNLFYADGREARFKIPTSLGVYPDDVGLSEAHRDIISDLDSDDVVELQSTPDNIWAYAIERFADYGEDDLD